MTDNPESWHTRQERRVIRKYGGEPHVSYGPDGTIRGRPVEVRSIHKDNRYRIQKDVHRVLLRRRGWYIFVSPTGESKVRSAQWVNDIIRRNERHWLVDRDYPHTFIYAHEVWA